MDFRNFPIKGKLTTVIMLTSTVVLLLAAAAFIVYEVVNIRHLGYYWLAINQPPPCAAFQKA